MGFFFQNGQATGCYSCPLNKTFNKHPNMKPTGVNKPLIYIIGECPGADEDEQGIQFVGKSGKLLRDSIEKLYGNKFIENNIRFNNLVRCRTASNRIPSEVEVKNCLPSVIEDIKKSKPLLIIGTGNIPLKALLQLNGITDWRGKFIPLNLGEFSCWYFTLLHPSFILRENNFLALEDLFVKDIKTAIDFVRNNDTYPIIEKEGYLEGITVIEGKDTSNVETIKARLLEMSNSNRISIDIETNGLRPYKIKNPKILSIAISNGIKTIAFPLHSVWSSKTTNQIEILLKTLFLNKNIEKIAHNVKFEMEWLNYFFGNEILFEGKWGDSLLQTYLIDEKIGRVGGYALDTLCRIHFGFSLKSLSNVDRTKLSELPIEKLLQYNALDAKYTYKLFEIQEKLLEYKLLKMYNFLINATISIVLMQQTGLDVSIETLKNFSSRLTKDIINTYQHIRKDKYINQFESVFREFKPGSSQDIFKLFKEIIKIDEKVTSTDKKFLEEQANKGYSISSLIIDYRELNKLKSTYVDSLLAGKDDNTSLLSIDNKLRAEFNLFFTKTGRLSSESPNMQNFPKRKFSYIRDSIIAPEGKWIVAFDYGQIEARVIAMASKCDTFCNSIRNGLDIHMKWAKRIKWLYPNVTNDDSIETMKELRNQVKNKMVFAWFYGSSKNSLINLGLPEKVITQLHKEFWEEFKGVKKWQDDLLRGYKNNGYIESLTGRRRRAPLTYTEILNAPIQSTASDIVVSAMYRLSKLAYITKKPQYQPVLNIHDDLTFILPDISLEEDINIIAEIMCEKSFDFINIPLEVEVAVGKSWGKLENIGKFITKGVV